MNKGKESYNNIPLPDSLSASIQKGLDRGKRYTEKNGLQASVLWRPPACVSWFSSAYFRFPEAIIPRHPTRLWPHVPKTPR